jgi:hypothetical protein
MNDINLIINPIIPMTMTPKKQILIDSHSSSLPGFTASFISLRAELKNDLKPIVAQPSRTITSDIKSYR